MPRLYNKLLLPVLRYTNVHHLQVYLSNIPEDRKVSPKQRTCFDPVLEDHPPRLEHLVSSQLCYCELKNVLEDLAMASYKANSSL